MHSRRAHNLHNYQSERGLHREGEGQGSGVRDSGGRGRAGAFPLWLAPVQARILPVTDAVAAYASEVAAKMRAAGIRVEVVSGAPACALFCDGGASLRSYLRCMPSHGKQSILDALLLARCLQALVLRRGAASGLAEALGC